MKNIMDFSYLNGHGKFYYINYKKLFKSKDYIRLASYDYENNYPLWSSYDYFIDNAIKEGNLDYSLRQPVNALIGEKTYFNDKDLITKINSKYLEVINYIQNHTNYVYGLDFIK